MRVSDWRRPGCGRGWKGPPSPGCFASQLDKGGRAVGIRHLNHSLSPPPPWATWWGGLPSPGSGAWRLQTAVPSPGELWVSPRAPAPSSESAFLTVCATWVPPLGGAEQGRRGCGVRGLPGRGVELGVNCIETSPPKQGSPGAEARSRASPALPASGQQRVGAAAEARDPRTLRRKFLPRGPTPETRRVSPRPSSALVACPCPPAPGPRRSPAVPTRQAPTRHPCSGDRAGGGGGRAGCPGPWVGPRQGPRAALTWSWAEAAAALTFQRSSQRR